MKRFCLTLDLKNDPKLIEEYKQHHRAVWPEIRASILQSGIYAMDIYLFGNRLFMVMETVDNFSFEAKASADAANKRVQQWETLMWRYQQKVPQARPGDKWILMERIFSLEAN
jgi:L-rhamnose mutarotase